LRRAGSASFEMQSQAEGSPRQRCFVQSAAFSPCNLQDDDRTEITTMIASYDDLVSRKRLVNRPPVDCGLSLPTTPSRSNHMANEPSGNASPQTTNRATLGLTGLTINAMALIAPGAFLWLTFQIQSLYGAPMAGSAMWFGIVAALLLCFATAISYA